jgi:hypothetical protein
MRIKSGVALEALRDKAMVAELAADYQLPAGPDLCLKA